MPPPDNGNEYIDFTQLIKLEKLGANVFRSIALAFGPAQGNRTYGGHVYMQACYAAAQTVPKDSVLHVSSPILPRVILSS
jgi:acyl-CoA thioesterase